MSTPTHSLRDYVVSLNGLWNRLTMKLFYGSQIKDHGLRQLCRVPVIRFRNGKVEFGRGTILRGELTVVFRGDTEGKLTLGESFAGDGNVVLRPRGGSISIGNRCFVGLGSALQANTGSAITLGNDVMIGHGVVLSPRITAPTEARP